MSDTSQPCPKCGEPIPPDSPEGLCPKCLLRQASIPTESGNVAAANVAPPAREELAAVFPQLEILELIGQGGMGFVFKARQPKLDRIVALKILPQSRAGDPAFEERFSREGRMLARLNHPNIVTIHDFGQAGGFFYLLMEYVDGVNLRQAMEVGRFTPAQALALVPKICEALQFAHDEGVLHRDIKPENILLDSKGRVKIADFGIAKLVGETPGHSTLTATGAVVGTPQYMAPEQLERSGEVDQRADIYSLGVVFYEMLTGELPLGKFQPPSQRVQVDVRLDEVVLHALEKDPARRYQQASEVKTAVDSISSRPADATAASVSGSPPKAAPVVAPASFLRIAKGKHLSRGVAAGALVCFVVSLVVTAVTFIMSDTYAGTARIKLNQMVPSGNAPSQYFDPYLIQNEFEIIQSEAVLTNVIDRLKLQETWSARRGDSITDVQAIEILRSMIELRPLRNTMVVEITVFDDRPGEAAEIANDIARQYVWLCAAKMRAVRVEIIDRAVPMVRPVRPNKPLNIALGILAGIVTGAIAGLMVALVSSSKSAGSAPQPAQAIKPSWDPFWRKFATIALLMVALPLALLIIAFLSYLMVPGFFKSRTTTMLSPFESPAATVQSNSYVGSEPTPTPGNDEIMRNLEQRRTFEVTGLNPAPGNLVIQPAPFDVVHPELGAVYWGFNGFIPPARLASFVFVSWSNGVPTVDPGFSTYFKVGKGGAIDVPFCLLACYRPVDTREFFRLTETQKSNTLVAWKYPESAGVSNAVRWDVNLGAGSTGSRWIATPPYHIAESTLARSVQTGHQAIIPLIEFNQPAGAADVGQLAAEVRVHDPNNGVRGLLPRDHGQSGVELRIFLEPLDTFPIRTLPGETDRTNYVVGKGLAWTVEQTLDRIKNLQIDP